MDGSRWGGGEGRLTSSSVTGGEQWWVGAGDNPQPDPTKA
jgi:hypothetical protein